MVENHNHGAKEFYEALGYTLDTHAFPMSKTRPQSPK